ncbi:DUF354 domain-containing protein [Thermococcus sp. GR6]|uniref:DUF354 domain-containing protein n=1 Tax=Thermococcus sp. GR6 TaxID=1638256 RepID=UPI001431843E|nr:DUF354 domain-containing protein [Thermococcus sp. GR6]NJE42900.1 DUF354 domain-containing protein [Thermococcus sp. GR6]
MYDLWIHITNTPQVFFFYSVIKDIREKYSIFITSRKRGETLELMKNLKLSGKVVGKDYKNPYIRSISVGLRSLNLLIRTPDFKTAIGFETAEQILTCKLRQKKAVLFLDNDIKLLGKAFFQKMETHIKKMADYFIVPECSKDNFAWAFDESKILTYPGYKEHVYISEYTPDENFLSNIPFKEYVVIRPESLTSLYVLHNFSLIPSLLGLFEKEDINVIYLPREKEDMHLSKNYNNVYIPPKVLNGLDLAYYAKAVLTGSGTMAREAAVLGTPAISFFPGERLLAVDKDLVNKGKMLHSREPEEIVEYVLANWNKKRKPEFEKAKQVKKQVIHYINDIIGD